MDIGRIGRWLYAWLKTNKEISLGVVMVALFFLMPGFRLLRGWIFAIAFGGMVLGFVPSVLKPDSYLANLMIWLYWIVLASIFVLPVLSVVFCVLDAIGILGALFAAGVTMSIFFSYLAGLCLGFGIADLRKKRKGN